MVAICLIKYRKCSEKNLKNRKCSCFFYRNLNIFYLDRFILYKPSSWTQNTAERRTLVRVACTMNENVWIVRSGAGEADRFTDSIPLELSATPGTVCPGDDVFDKRRNDECLDPGINSDSFIFRDFTFWKRSLSP